MSGRTGEWIGFDWHGRTARAWDPAPLSDRELDLDIGTVRATELALRSLSRSDDHLPANWEPLARLLLRTEGIASSSIEGVRAPLEQIALAELDPASGDVGWIVDNLSTVEGATGTDRLTIEELHAWHSRLMTHSHLSAEQIGAFRTEPGWIGGTSPLDAVFVPAPATRIDDLMADLVAFANGDRCDPITTAAVVHGQFETIHPYGDGNGRLGRILVGWVLRRRGVVRRLPPPISVLIARDVGGYLAGLLDFREGRIDSWVRWFADTSVRAATQSDQMIDQVGTILDDWDQKTDDLRRDSAARRALPLLPRSPVINAGHLATILGVSDRAARTALDALAERGIVEPIQPPPTGRGRPPRWWAATALLDATRRWTS